MSLSLKELNEMLGITPESQAKQIAERKAAREAARAKGIVFCIQIRGLPIVRVACAEDAWDNGAVEVRGRSAGYSRDDFIRYFETNEVWVAYAVTVRTEPIEKTDESDI